MVAESFTPGASVSKVAQRYGLNANLLFTWRRQEARSAAVGGCQRRRKGQPLGRRHFGPVALVEGGRERSAPSWRRSERAAAGAVRLMGLRRADWPRGDRGRAHQARQRGLGGLWPWVAPPLRLCGGQQIA